MRALRPVRGYWSSSFFPPRPIRVQAAGIGTSTVKYPPHAQGISSTSQGQSLRLRTRVGQQASVDREPGSVRPLRCPWGVVLLGKLPLAGEESSVVTARDQRER